MRKFLSIILFTFIISVQICEAQLFAQGKVFTHADSLQGNNATALRTCYDINYYHLDVRFDIDKRFISGSNQFKFTAISDFSILQFDLFNNLQIEKIVFHNQTLKYLRDANAVFVTFPKTIKKNTKDEFTVFYSGFPKEARKAPFESGIVFAKDSLGNPFTATACESSGASIWWPNKDQLADEVDSMLISVAVPAGFQDVSNGHLRSISKTLDGFTKYNWFVANPINNYDVAMNIAKYAHFNDTFYGENGKLNLDYWLLPYNVKKGKTQFKTNVASMLSAYEYWFGAYPFYKDGYKLVETPYPAMEHQSAISYGGYLKGGPTNALVGVEGGKKWDYIIDHESAHEWFGNSITAKDMADLWIHEAFASYAESLFLESQYDKTVGLQYLNSSRKNISNNEPIVGSYGVRGLGSGDMYAKGSMLLNMIRVIVDDDKKWRFILREINKKFYHQTITYSQLVNYFSEESGINLTTVFKQYLHYKNIPTLEFSNRDGKLNARWVANVQDFRMPILIKLKSKKFHFIYPSTKFQPIDKEEFNKDEIMVDTFNFYVGVLID